MPVQDSLNVIAKKGVQVPMEGRPRKYITAAKAVPVKNSSYYRRRIAEGDLKVVPGGGSPTGKQSNGTGHGPAAKKAKKG